VKAQQTLGQNINRLRTQKKLTQNLLADLATIDRRFLQRIEAGESGPTIEVLAKLKRALKCSWEELLRGIN
jgi:transcriptional regulator with XRE-family HTH domain